MTETCFRMKGTTLTSIVLEVLDFEPDNFEAQLSQKVASAPQFFTRSSLILHLIKPLSATEFELLVALCRRLQLQPMAVKGEVAELKPTINDLGLADVSQSKFTDSALSAIAQKAHVQKTGARGLRAILEEVMLDIMYDIPSQTDIREVVITEDVILKKGEPLKIFEQSKAMKPAVGS